MNLSSYYDRKKSVINEDASEFIPSVVWSGLITCGIFWIYHVVLCGIGALIGSSLFHSSPEILNKRHT